MAFYWDTNVGEYLFPGLNINGTPALVILCLVLVFFTILFEAVKVFQTKTRARAAREVVRVQSCPASERVNLLNIEHANRLKLPISRKFITLFGQAFIFLFQNTLGYLLMLTVMVYNGYIFLVVIFGMGLGFFIFGNRSMRINMENIRARTTNAICSPKCSTQASTSQPDTALGGYVNEMVASSSSTSSTISDNYNNSNYTQTSLLDKEVEIHHTNEDTNIQSCRL